ncbi:MAG: UDP-N-acetylmuramoyl-L-alanyl-D-glutamate--2,6-diaminopimelate ligase [Anaerolineae bacterium]
MTLTEMADGHRQWILRDLLQAAGLPASGVPATLVVSDVQADSRLVRPGSLFVAYKGLEADGHTFIEAAIRAGAVAVVAERAPDQHTPVPLILTPCGRLAWARLCAAWQRFPSCQLRMAGITGTDGKTTTASLLHYILNACGLATGLVSTVNARIGEQAIDTGLHTTTPPPSQVQALLADMVAAGCTAAIIEATSEGLAQERLAACNFDLAIMTNVTHDHLYYHSSFEAYREAKAMLFRYLTTSQRKPGLAKVAILNRDDPSYDYFAGIQADEHITYSQQEADVVASVLASDAHGLRLHLASPWGKTELHVPLVGAYNAYNVAAAMAAACTWGISMDAAAAAIASFPGVPGRMDFIRLGQPFNVVVDFAHTANALQQVLRAARLWTAGNLIVVFGCAGERDVLKRQPMARIAIELADHAIFTAEDPRREKLGDILAQMEWGARQAGGTAGQHYRIVADRARAIWDAIAMAHPGDTVLLCGKGHEQSMCYGREEQPWNERKVAEAALLALGYGSPSG